MLNEYGHDATLHVITRLLMNVDSMLGNENSDYDRLQTIAANALHTNMHRSFGFLVLSIRDGINRTDRDGKGFNKVTVQLIAEWTAAQEGKLIGLIQDEHARVSYKNDNLRGEDMDRLEHDANSKDRKIASMGRTIDQLKNKLENKP